MISPDPDSHESVTAPVDSHLRGWLIIAGVLWAASLFGVWILARIKKEIHTNIETTRAGENLWKQKRTLASLILTIGFLGWFLIHWFM